MIIKLFEEQVKKNSGKIAIKDNQHELTYDDLNRYANRVAYKILEKCNPAFRLSDNERIRYTRQLLIEGWDLEAQEKLKRTTVFVAGAGGSGSPLIMQLALCGIGNIIVCDYDEVDLSNLNRQCLHDESIIGMNKALSAQLSINKLNPNVKVIPRTEKITKENVYELVGNSSIIFDNVDDLETKFILSECAVQKQIPHIISSMIDINSYVAIFHTPKTPCFHCLYDRQKLSEIEEIKSLVTDYKRIPNSVASPSLFLSTGFACNEAIKIILGFENPAYNKYFLFNQRGSKEVVNTKGHLTITYPFSSHFRRICKEQGFDWDEGWRGNFLEELEIRHDPECPVCKEAVRQSSGLKNKMVNKNKAIVCQTHAGEKTQNVALLFNHGSDMIVGTIGALKACKTYVPLDPTYPEQRLLYMIESSESSLIITNNKNHMLAQNLVSKTNNYVKILNIDKCKDLEFDENMEREIDDNRIAYILYTSGSTGQPKGVFQSHKNVVHFIKCYTKELSINEQDKMTLFSAFNHDAAIMDIYGALLNGATLYPVNIKDQGNMNDIATWLQKEEITIWHSVPTLYRYFTNILTEKIDFPKLRFIVLGGDAVVEHDIEKFKMLFSNSKLMNLYGQTESSYNSSQIFTSDSAFQRITLGQPVDKTEIIVVDENREEVSPLKIGEIVVLSKYVACGYWKDEEKTKAVFEYNHEVGSLYWTGDLGRLLVDGNIEFVGRKGSLLKIRGYRVEVGEIESHLLTHESIKEAIVLGRTDKNENENYLCAYLVADTELKISEIREYLSKRLPEYMIPMYFIQLKKMPLNSSGKISRKELPDPEENGNNEVEYREATNEIEIKLIEIWSKILGRNKIGINDNFFHCGGHSLKATKLAYSIHKEFNVEMQLVEIFKNPTVKEMAEYIGNGKKNVYETIQVIEERDYYPVSFAQKRMFILNQLRPDSTNYNMPIIFKVKGKPDKIRIQNTIHYMIQRHKALRVSLHLVEDEIMQKVDNNPLVDIKFSRAEGKNLDEIVKHFIKPFNLKTGPLTRFEIVTLSEENFIFMFDIHHIISDGTSAGILIKEFLDLYRGKKLSDLKVQYTDYAVWENNLFASGEMKKQENYWLQLFKEEPLKLNMPLDFVRPNKQTFDGNRVEFKILKETLEKVNSIAQSQKTTLNIVLFSIYTLLLHKYSEQCDITSGLIMAGRNHPDLEKMIGVFINFLPIRVRINTESSFIKFLDAEKKVIIDAYDNRNYPFDEIVAKVVREKDSSRNPIFDTMFILHNQYDYDEKINVDKVNFKRVEIKKDTSKLDFKIDAISDQKGNLDCILEYNTHLFKEETINKFIKHFNTLINVIIENPEVKLSDINIFSEDERKLMEENRKNNLRNEEDSKINIVSDSLEKMTLKGSTDREIQKQEYKMHRSKIEEKLINMWSELLNVKEIGLDDDFFQIGGYSLKAISLIVKMYKEFNVEVPLEEIFVNPTIRKITDYIISNTKTIFNHRIMKLNEQKKYNIFAFPPIIGYGFIFKELAMRMASHTMYSLDFIEDDDRIELYIRSIKDIQKDGPYVLLGYSAGGNLAFEVARELEKQGEDVSDVILLDSLIDNRHIEKSKHEIAARMEKTVKNFFIKEDPVMVNHIEKDIAYKVEKYIEYLCKIVNNEAINSNVHLIVSETNKDKREINEWAGLTNRNFKLYKGFGEHNDMLDEGKLTHNAAIISKILNKFNE